MEPPPVPAVPLGEQPRLPFSKRWEQVKPILHHLYIEKNFKLPQLAEAMRKPPHYFDASDHQYKFQFKKWKFKKIIPAAKKDVILHAAGQRSKEGKSSAITYQGKQVDAQKLVRHAKKIAKEEKGENSGGLEFLGGGPFLSKIFLEWNAPFGITRNPQNEHLPVVNHTSPAASANTPLTDVSMHTPPATGDSPRDAPSPLSTVLKHKTAVENLKLLLQGKHDELFRSLSPSARRTMSTWLYQFRLFSFTTAKHWGRGRRDWTAEALGFLENTSPFIAGSPHPAYASGSPFPHSTPSPGRMFESQLTRTAISSPTQLCNWSIHVYQDDYDELAPDEPMDIDSESLDQDTAWPPSWHTPPFEQKLRDNLETNDFSSVNARDLPIAIPHLAKAAQRSDGEFLQQALGFAIMGRNVDLVMDLVTKIQKADMDVSSLHPLHLAITYLDGSRSCCHILQVMDRLKVSGASLRDDSGYTLFDSLMITILKSHTSLAPGTMNSALSGSTRFPGEEIDICGRWDAESRCYRELLDQGFSKVPISWKHKFCHTSIQAVVHVTSMLGWRYGVWSSPSGLFVKYCENCGARLELTPVHTLVLSMFHLGNSGTSEEDLFGATCCLLAMVSDFEFPATIGKVDLSTTALFGGEKQQGCGHSRMSPVELASRVPESELDKWPQRRLLGWRLFTHVLERIERIACDVESGLSKNEAGIHEELGFSALCIQHGHNFSGFGADRHLGHLWASIQTELLNYRRQRDGEPWVSEYFCMETALEDMVHSRDMSIPLVRRHMMTAYCPCGYFPVECPRREMASAFYFSNLQDWNRTAVLDDRRVDEFTG